jgi:DHA3 family tetracycline resistance protein-like MFS transporter
MDPLQLVLVGTVLEASYLLFEMPTGIIADVYSRRLSIIIGHLLFGAASILGGAVPIFGVILLAEVIRAVGEACLSGATQAWIADEIGEEHVGALFLRAAQVGRGAGLLGIGASVALASVSLTLPIVVGGVISMALAGLLLIVMPEQHFRPLERTGLWPDMRRTAASGVGQLRQQPLLLAFLAIAAAIGASSEGYDRLWQAHFLAAFTFPSLGELQPVVWFGIFSAVGSVLSIVAAQALVRLDLTDDRVLARYGLLAHGGWLIAVCVLGLAPSFTVAVLALWAAGVLRSIGRPILDAWETRSIPSQVRATVLSTLSQGDALGQILGGPVVGWIGTVYSLRAALVATGLLHTPVLLLLTHARRLLDVPSDAPTSGPDLAPAPPS